MASVLLRDAEEHHPVAWALQSFTVNHEYKSTGPSQLYLDRANGEFGIVSQALLAITTLAQYPDDDPIYFEGKGARAASWRAKCKKVSLLFQHAQVDLEFASIEQAHSFLHMVEDIAMAAGNKFFYSYDVPLGIPFVRADFDMVKHGFIDRSPQSWLSSTVEGSEWPRLRQTGDWSDFTILAEGKTFSVHRVRLCKKSQYFKAACSGGFSESVVQSIELSESAQTVGALLDEMYETYNSTTGSLFTNFALRPEIEKEQAMTQLLELFIACDKYNLEKVKQKVCEAIIDRFPFVKDPLTIVDLAANIHHEQFPHMDGGLRRTVIAQIDARLPALIADDGAWEEYSGNKTVMKALHAHQCETREYSNSCAAVTVTVTPPVTPPKNDRKFRA